MEIKLFYKTQRELATSLNQIIDTYWENKIDKATLIKTIKDLYINDSSK